MIEKPYYIHTEWDPEAGVWVASSDDVPGLVTEAETMELLISKLRIMIPELLELNEQTTGGTARSFEVLSRRFESLQPASV